MTFLPLSLVYFVERIGIISLTPIDEDACVAFR